MNSLYGWGGPQRMQSAPSPYRPGIPRMSTPMMGTPNAAQPSPIQQQIAQQMTQAQSPQAPAQWGLQRPPTRGIY